MNRKFETCFAALCIAAALGAGCFAAYRVLSQDAAGRESAKVDFDGLRSVLAYVKSPSDLADPGLRARLASRYEASPGLLLVDVYERGTGDRWRMPSDSPYLNEAGRDTGAPKSSYPPASTILLSSPLKGDSSGKLAVDALYVSLPQAAAFGAFRDALIGLGAFLAAAAFVLAVALGRKAKIKTETTFDFSGATSTASAAEKGAEAAPTAGTIPAAEASEEDLFAEEWDIEDKAAAAAHYQFETLGSEAADAELAPHADEEFDIPVMDEGSSAVEEVAEAEETDTETGSSDASTDFEDGPVEPPGLYSPASGLGWESYIKERLDAELSRSASFEQDLSILVFCYDGLTSQDELYVSIGKTIKSFFSFRDLAFERGDDGFSIILPNIDSSHALRMADEFYRKLVFLAEGDFSELELMPLYMGISSRAGRLVDAKRLIEEASAALERARYEKDTHIVAFRPDPDKYRQFLTAKGGSV
jgi:GGDEF domain-containing protein